MSASLLCRYLMSAYLLCAVELLNILRCFWYGTYNKQTTTQSWPSLKAAVLVSVKFVMNCIVIQWLNCGFHVQKFFFVTILGD